MILEYRIRRTWSGTATQPGIAADRFARKMVAFCRFHPARSRQLNANPLGGQAKKVASRSGSIGHRTSCLVGCMLKHTVSAWGVDTHAWPVGRFGLAASAWV